MATQGDDVAMDPLIESSSGSRADHSVTAQRLMRRLEACDKQLSMMLNQTADSLESLLNSSRQTAGFGEQADLGEFEDLAQDWLASVYDTQLMLRKAIRFLVRASRPPIMTAAHSFVQGGGVSAAVAGTAFRGSSLNEATQGKKRSGEESGDSGPKGVVDGADEGKGAELSMSALRLKHQAWKDLVSALELIEQRRHTSSQASLAGPEGDLLRLLGLTTLDPFGR